MSQGGSSDRSWEADPEAVFAAFVTRSGPVATGGGSRVGLGRESGGLNGEWAPAPAVDDATWVVHRDLAVVRTLAEPEPEPEPLPLVRAPSADTQRREAALVVPDVARVTPPPEPPREGSIDGQMPAFELDRILSDMAVLMRYGHGGQVRERLDTLLQQYPEDLLLLRRVSEFYLEAADGVSAVDALFTLATRLFERRNVEGMRGALEQILVLDPQNRRAYKLLGLLDQRPSAGTGH